MQEDKKEDVNPQKENGFVPIASEIMDALCRTKISGTQRQCLDFIIRKTYGFHKKEDDISYAQFEKATGLPIRSIRRNLKCLEERNIIGMRKNAQRCAQKCAHVSSTYWFNKKYDQWDKKEGYAQKCAEGMRKNDRGVCAKMRTTIDNNNRYNIYPGNSEKKKPKKTTKKKKEYSTKIKDFVGRYIEYVEKEFPRRSPEITDSLVSKSMDTIDKLERLDDFDHDEIVKILRWAVKNEFWNDQIFSLASLRKKSNNGLSKFQNIYNAYKKDLKLNNIPEEPLTQQCFEERLRNREL